MTLMFSPLVLRIKSNSWIAVFGASVYNYPLMLELAAVPGLVVGDYGFACVFL